MPLKKYFLLRKAVRVAEMQKRLQFITDVNAAFNGNEKHIRSLERGMHELLEISDKKDSDWVDRLQRFAK